MANIAIRDLPDKTKETLCIHAAQAGVSLEAYARHILQKASLSNAFESVNILEIAAKCEAEGNNTDAVDLTIAAMAKCRQAAIATRNTKNFAGCDLEIINPWIQFG